MGTQVGDVREASGARRNVARGSGDTVNERRGVMNADDAGTQLRTSLCSEPPLGLRAWFVQRFRFCIRKSWRVGSPSWQQSLGEAKGSASLGRFRWHCRRGALTASPKWFPKWERYLSVHSRAVSKRLQPSRSSHLAPALRRTRMFLVWYATPAPFRDVSYIFRRCPQVSVLQLRAQGLFIQIPSRSHNPLDAQPQTRIIPVVPAEEAERPVLQALISPRPVTSCRRFLLLQAPEISMEALAIRIQHSHSLAQSFHGQIDSGRRLHNVSQSPGIGYRLEPKLRNSEIEKSVPVRRPPGPTLIQKSGHRKKMLPFCVAETRHAPLTQKPYSSNN